MSDNPESDRYKPLEPPKFNQKEEALAAYVAQANEQLAQPVDSLTRFFKSLVIEARNSGIYNSNYVIPTVLTAIPLATQGKIAVRMPNGSTTNLNVAINVFGEASTGKTRTILHWLSANLLNEGKIRAQAHEKQEAFAISIKALRLEAERLKRLYLRAETSEEERIEVQKLLAIISRQMLSPKPGLPNRIVDYATPKAMVEQLIENEGVLGLIATDGYGLYMNTLKKELTLANQLNDGSGYSRTTRDLGSIHIEKVSFNMLIAMQNDLFAKIYVMHDDQLNRTGFMSRFLPFIYVNGMDGGMHDKGFNSSEYFNQYSAKIDALYARTNEGKDEVLELEDELGEEISQWCHATKMASAVDTTYFVERIEIHVIKLSAIITLLEDPKATFISKKAFSAAKALFEYARRTHHAIAHDEALYNGKGIAEDAKKVLKVIKSYIDSGEPSCATSWILARAPSNRRKMELLQPVLDYLELSGEIRKHPNNSACYCLPWSY